MFVVLKIIPAIATIDRRGPSVVSKLDSPSTTMVSTVTSHITPQCFTTPSSQPLKLDTCVQPEATKAPTVIIPVTNPGIANGEALPHTNMQIQR